MEGSLFLYLQAWNAMPDNKFLINVWEFQNKWLIMKTVTSSCIGCSSQHFNVFNLFDPHQITITEEIETLKY